MEMDLAVDGGLGKTEGYVTGVPQSQDQMQKQVPQNLEKGRIYLMAPVPPIARMTLTS